MNYLWDYEYGNKYISADPTRLYRKFFGRTLLTGSIQGFVRYFWFRFITDFAGTACLSCMEVCKKRKFKRVGCKFTVTLFDEKLNLFVRGMTADLSQCGAFVQMQPYDLFRAGAPLTITVFLPPEFTGQDKTIRLQGDAVVSRIDEAHKGVAVEFSKPLRQFKRISEH